MVKLFGSFWGRFTGAAAPLLADGTVAEAGGCREPAAGGGADAGAETGGGRELAGRCTGGWARPAGPARGALAADGGVAAGVGWAGSGATATKRGLPLREMAGVLAEVVAAAGTPVAFAAGRVGLLSCRGVTKRGELYV